MISGQPKFDVLAVTQFSVSFLGPTLEFVGEAAFMNSKTGDTHGWTKNKQWSPATIEKLKELRASMEVDLGQLHLSGGGAVLIGPSTVPAHSRDLSGGLGEHLGDGVPQV